MRCMSKAALGAWTARKAWPAQLSVMAGLGDNPGLDSSGFLGGAGLHMDSCGCYRGNEHVHGGNEPLLHLVRMGFFGF